MEFVNGLLDWQLWVMLGVGVGLVFMGYRIKKIAFFIIWFLLGYNLVGFLLPEIIKVIPEIGASQIWQILVPIMGGLLLALLGFAIEKVCVSGICFVLVMLMTVQQFGTSMEVMTVGGIVAVILAGAATMLMKPATIVATAMAGGYALSMALIVLVMRLGGSDISGYYWPMLLSSATLGSLVQFMTTKNVS